MPAEAYDIVVVGGGTAGAFAAATAASEGLDVALLERKTEAEAGHIACGDAIKGKSTFPDVIDLDYLKDESFTNRNIRQAIFENPRGGSVEIDFGEPGAVIDRKRYVEIILAEADRLGADLHFETVVQDVTQDDGAVTGVRAKRDGDVVTYDAEVTIDAAGALSILQDKTDFSNTYFDTNVSYSQFCSAYREVVEVPEPVDYDDAIVFKPTEELGYLWYFPRKSREVNVGLGFQMSEPPMDLVDVLKRDLDDRQEFEGASVKDKLGAALPTRRPYDSAVAPGFMSVGDAAGHVNPTTGGGIPGAAKAGHWAAQAAVEAIGDGTVSESALWAYNRRVQTDFGKRFAAMDIYNIFGTAHDVDELTEVVTAVRTRGHWETLREGQKVGRLASRLKDIYDEYPESPAEFDDWRNRRDALMEQVYEVTGADPKY